MKTNEETVIRLSDLGAYYDTHEIWDEELCDWVDIKNSCYVTAGGFPDPYRAEVPVTAITITYINGSILTFGCGEYEVEGEEIYFKSRL